MQHRVKNNFQLILSSVSIQKQRYKGEDVQRALDHIGSRINAISLAHDQLALRDQNQVVNVSDYLRSLCSSIRQQVENVDIDIEADEMTLSIDRAVPLGLILNEVATNSIKHAFRENGGKIHVQLTAGVGYSEGRLVVADNGMGIGKAKSNGSGLKLIEALARQIGGRVRQDSSDKGTSTAIEFPVIA
jgi:two-component sensor histidine kinase